MSAYRYVLSAPSAPTVRIELPGGGVCQAVVLKYAYKPSWSDETWNRKMERRYIEPARRAWEGKPKPAYVVTAYEGQVQGGVVIEWRADRVCCYDDPDWGGMLCVGYYDRGQVRQSFPIATGAACKNTIVVSKPADEPWTYADLYR